MTILDGLFRSRDDYGCIGITLLDRPIRSRDDYGSTIGTRTTSVTNKLFQTDIACLAHTPLPLSSTRVVFRNENT